LDAWDFKEMMTEQQNAVMYGLEVVIAISYVYAVFLIGLALFSRAGGGNEQK
jgi:hypothetical protein